jgi:hypothetical protein
MRRERPHGELASLLGAAGAVLLLVSLFLDWYVLPGFTITAWTAFEVWDVVLAVIGLAVVLSVATDLGWWRGPVHSHSITLLGGLALLIVASQLINRPPSALHSQIGTGGWLALVGSGAIAIGSLLAESRVTVSFNPAAPAADRAGPAARRTGAWRRPRQPAAPPPVATAVPPVEPVAPQGPVSAVADHVAQARPGPATERVPRRPVDPDGETVVAPEPPPPRRRV